MHTWQEREHCDSELEATAILAERVKEVARDLIEADEEDPYINEIKEFSGKWYIPFSLEALIEVAKSHLPDEEDYNDSGCYSDDNEWEDSNC